MDLDATPDRQSSRLSDALCASCAVGAAALVLWSTAPFGAGVDSDSAQYLSAAESVSRGAGWIAIDSAPYTLWPPLFPSLLAALKFVGFSMVGAARWLGAASAFVVVLGCASSVARISRARWAAPLCAFAVASSSPILANCAMALSEPVFLALCVAACWSWLAYASRASTPRFFTLAALSAAALVQRYLGVTLVASIALMILCQPTQESWLRRLRRSAAYVALAAAPLALWLVRNRLVTGSLDGKRGPAVGSLARDTHNTWAWFTKWFAFELDQRTLAGLLMLVPIALFLAAAWSSIKRESRGRIFVVFPALYLAGLIALRQCVEFDELDERLLSPAVPATWVALALGADVWLQLGRRVVRAAAATVIALWFCAHVAFAALELRQRVVSWHSNGVGLYDQPHWQHSPTVEWIRSQPPGGVWLTNDPFAVFCTTGVRMTILPLRKQGFARLRDRLAEKPAERHVVWFTLNERAVFPAEMLQPALQVERVQKFADGEIYMLR